MGTTSAILETTSYYDAFATRLLTDFVHGNERAESAIRHAILWLPRRARRVLDIGCGIGWSSWEIKRQRAATEVVGIDLSPRMMELASALFPADGLAFHRAVIGADARLAEGRFEGVVLLDLYEHVPRHDRETFHKQLSELLAPESRLILSFPSPSHQNRLRTAQPDGLQPVDEDVSREDVECLARDLGARVRIAEEISVWETGDYVHAVIERGSPTGDPHTRRQQRQRLASRHMRATLVRERLGVRVGRDGLLLPDRGRVTVCVISPNSNAYSETFIRAHVERLPARIEMLVGGWLPTHSAEGVPLLSPGLLPRVARAVRRRVLSGTYQLIQTEALVQFLRAHRIDAVLCEYGPTGVMCLPACRAARVPLTVHFHGFDAYDGSLLEEFGGRYPELFGGASAIVAVSRHMRQALLDLGAPPEKLHYNPCGVDTTLFHGANPSAVPPHFLAVGRFVDKKAPHLTILAFRKVASLVPGARLAMIGDGPLLESSHQLVRALGVDDRVDFMGPRPPLEVATAMRRSRAFVQHSVVASYGDSEGTPVAILEAGASGLPVVATRHRGIADVVVEGSTGLLVDEGDVEAMAGHMLRLATDGELAAELGSSGRDHVVKHYSIEESVAGLWRILTGTMRPGAERVS